MLVNNYKINKVILQRMLMLVLAGLSLFYVDQAFAYYNQQTTGAGGVANDLMEPVGFVSDFIHAACLILGTSFIFASVIKYFEHRRSPLMVTMSTVVFLFVAGIVLLVIPLFSYFYSSIYGLGL